MDGALDRIERENRVQIEAAWLTAKLIRLEKLPGLDEILRSGDARDPEEVAAEQRAQLRTFSATLPARTWEEWRQR